MSKSENEYSVRTFVLEKIVTKCRKKTCFATLPLCLRLCYIFKNEILQ